MGVGIPEGLAARYAARKVVLFVGAGASVPRGLPAWRELLELMLKRALAEKADVQAEDVKELIESGDLLDAADHLRESLGRNFRKFLQEQFRDPGLAGGDLHRLLPTLNFAAILTTNYDKLIESEFRSPRVYTQLQRRELEGMAHDGEFAIVKVHGDVDNLDSIVLGRGDYRKEMYGNPAFQRFREYVFSSHTVLFAGYSLTDPDLLAFLEERSGAFGGSHYALMKTKGMNNLRRKRFEKDYGIQIIGDEASDDFPDIAGFLKQLHREAGKVPQKAPAVVTSASGDDTLARKRYLDCVVRQHRYIRFSGMAEVGALTEVEMARVFVMPRVAPAEESTPSGRSEPKPMAAYKLLTGKKTPQRIVLLGRPGAGKTTLAEAIALAFAGGVSFPWTAELPELLPVFYRIRDLDKDRETQPDIWECIRHQCSRRLGGTLPSGFFQRQERSGGLVLLFDGLDEAGSLARRNEIVDAIGGFAEELSANSRVIVTSRPLDYRHRFDAARWKHHQLAEFDDEEVQTFIQGWRQVHEPDRVAAVEKGHDLWKALESRQDILPLARNALLLTMIVRVHFGLGALPDSRLGLYAKCAETLLKHWADAAGLGESPVDFTTKHKLLERLAYELQGEAEQLSPEMSLQISRTNLSRRFGRYLDEEGRPDAFHLVDKLVDRLHARDAVLVQFGTDRTGQDMFGYVHRSFQEYFAGCWMAKELKEPEFQSQLMRNRSGWSETLYLAVAQLPDRRRRETLLELLKTGRAEFAVDCLRAGPAEQEWLRLLVQFLARYTWSGQEYEGLEAAQCAEACAGRAESMEVLQAMFQPENREGRSLAAAVELAEELARNGDADARALIVRFFAEAVGFEEEMVKVAAGAFPYGDEGRMVEVAEFAIDRYPVTNAEYERMVPGHRQLRSWPDTDRHPVINVNWFEARLYCRWRGCRLPAEQEWEKAAGWDPAARKKRAYPWGDEFDPARCNTSEQRLRKTTPVGAYPNGRSAYGCEDMAGNVWEWTDSWRDESQTARVLRGGSWILDRDGAACAYRGVDSPHLRHNFGGFRCART